jgi:hypothetical protein
MAFTFKLRGKTYSAETLAEVSKLYSFMRDESCEGNSKFPKPTVRGPSGIIGSFSYNGRIWDGKPTDNNRTIVYDNRI